jgi:hypothetical protein
VKSAAGTPRLEALQELLAKDDSEEGPVHQVQSTELEVSLLAMMANRDFSTVCV